LKTGQTAVSSPFTTVTAGASAPTSSGKTYTKWYTSLHQIIRDDDFPEYPKKAIIRSIYRIEKQILEQSLNNKS
jgi:hypothetical protein